MSDGNAPHCYLSCTAHNGRLYLSYTQGVDGELRLNYWTHADALKVFEPAKGDRLIHSIADLDAVLQDSRHQSLRMVFVSDDLEEEARRRTIPKRREP